MKHIFIRTKEIEDSFEDTKHNLRKRDDKKYSDEEILEIILRGYNGK